MQSSGIDSGTNPNYVPIMGWRKGVFMRKEREIIT